MRKFKEFYCEVLCDSLFGGGGGVGVGSLLKNGEDTESVQMRTLQQRSNM